MMRTSLEVYHGVLPCTPMVPEQIIAEHFMYYIINSSSFVLIF